MHFFASKAIQLYPINELITKRTWPAYTSIFENLKLARLPSMAKYANRTASEPLEPIYDTQPALVEGAGDKERATCTTTREIDYKR
jgi:hypothetical protein